MNSTSFFNYPNEPQPTSQPIISHQFWPSRPAEDWKTLLNYVQTLRFKGGDTVVDIGQKGNGFYIISFGQYREGEVLHTEGDAIGILPFFDSLPHNKKIVAVTEGELLNLNRDGLASLGAREPLLARDILLELGRIMALHLR